MDTCSPLDIKRARDQAATCCWLLPASGQQEDKYKKYTENSSIRLVIS